MSKKIIVGLSGGVDSSVAAFLLQQQGFEVEGLFMKNWDEDDQSDYCPAAIDLADAQIVCNTLDIPLNTVNFAKAYWDNVFEHFLDEYNKGRTPNPDVLCNKHIKFDAFYHHALSLGADYIATGHYAKVANQGLYKARDRGKDQTYFLHAINPATLARTLFPIGEYQKTEIRQIAEEQKLVTHNKKDSTGICFIGEKRFKPFLQEYLLSQPGNIVDTQGRHLGHHDGLMFYTLGQRQGLHIGGVQGGFEEPWYVVDKDIDKNNLIVAQGQHHPMLYAQGLISGAMHWLVNPLPEMPLTCYAKIRYRQLEQPCVISPENNGEHVIMFATPVRAATPGQYIVFYQGNQCLGGAVIEQIIR